MLAHKLDPKDAFERNGEWHVVQAGEGKKQAVAAPDREGGIPFCVLPHWPRRSLLPHLSSTQDIHQQVVVANALLEERAGVRYRADPWRTKELIQCPFPECPGVLSSPCMLHRHFRDQHPKDTVENDAQCSA
jgi:hypothetical protein